jgi:pimeloyl-ACP methyl ester carboxylesterase
MGAARGLEALRKEVAGSSGRISYLEAGPLGGDPMVWLHGVGRRATSFEPQLEHFAAGWRVFAPDARGHGYSARVPNRYSWADHAGDLVEFLRTRHATPAVLVGHSLGAMQAVAAAAVVPELVRAAILVDPPLYAAERSDYDLSVFIAMEQAVTAGMSAEQILAVWPREPWMTDWFRSDQAESLTQLDPENLRVTIDRSATRGFDVDDYLARIGCPTLVMRADSSNPALRASDQDRALRQIANGRGIVFESCGHLIDAERPQEFRQAVEQYLASIA